MQIYATYTKYAQLENRQKMQKNMNYMNFVQIHGLICKIYCKIVMGHFADDLVTALRQLIIDTVALYDRMSRKLLGQLPQQSRCWLQPAGC